MRPDGGGWWLCGEVRWWRNPRHLLPAAWLHAARLWHQSRGGMGRGWLPEAGGVNDQPAWLVEAFGVLNAEQARLDDLKSERTGR